MPVAAKTFHHRLSAPPNEVRVRYAEVKRARSGILLFLGFGALNQSTGALDQSPALPPRTVADRLGTSFDFFAQRHFSGLGAGRHLASHFAGTIVSGTKPNNRYV